MTYGEPCLNVATAAAYFFLKVSAIDAATYTRVVAMQIWPVSVKAEGIRFTLSSVLKYGLLHRSEKAKVLAALSRSASSKTMEADFPPSSRLTSFRLELTAAVATVK